MRLNYNHTKTLAGLPIIHAYGCPFYIIPSWSGGKSEVIGPDGKVYGKSWSWIGARRIASRLNKQWLVTERLKGSR